MVKPVLLIITLLVFFVLKDVSHPSKKEDQQEYVIHGYAQGTDYTVKYFAQRPCVLKNQIDSLLGQIDASMSLYRPDSRIIEFNESVKGLIIDSQFQAVIRRAFEIHSDTRGKFDVTVAPLVQAWGFGATPVTRFPDRKEIKSLLKVVGMDGLELEGDYLSKRRLGLKVDLNGIAQGYSVDEVGRFLEELGIGSFVVEIGGEILVKGLRPDGSARRIGIEGPAETQNAEPQLRHIISVKKGAITTSGNYRKFLQKGAKKITHLINPKTGYPLENEMISVTVFAKDAITADGYDNALMGMKLKEALAFIAQRKELEAYFIYREKDGRIADTLSSGFKEMIVK